MLGSSDQNKRNCIPFESKMFMSSAQAAIAPVSGTAPLSLLGCQYSRVAPGPAEAQVRPDPLRPANPSLDQSRLKAERQRSRL